MSTPRPIPKWALVVTILFIAAAGFMLFWIASGTMTDINHETGKSVVVGRR